MLLSLPCRWGKLENCQSYCKCSGSTVEPLNSACHFGRLYKDVVAVSYGSIKLSVCPVNVCFLVSGEVKLTKDYQVYRDIQKRS